MMHLTNTLRWFGIPSRAFAMEVLVAVAVVLALLIGAAGLGIFAASSIV